MVKFAILGASALVLALGVASASAEPFNPTTGAPGYINGQGYYGNGNGYNYNNGYNNNFGYGSRMDEGRAAAIDGQAPFFGVPTPFYGQPTEGSAPGSVVLQQFHEAGGAHR